MSVSVSVSVSLSGSVLVLVYGVPDKFLSDNSPQYVSQEFAKLAKAYDFQLITGAPHYTL